MKLLPSLFYRRFIFAGMLVVALSYGATLQTFSSSTDGKTPAPSGAATPKEMDKETNKPIITTPSGLKYVDLTVGTGAALKKGDHILVNYEGKLEDGKKFDSSYDRGQPFALVLGTGMVIPGWDEGLATMKVGGVRKLIIPPLLAYGQQGFGDVIPPNSTLIFKVEVVSVQK